MALRAVHGNRAEVLLGALIEALPPCDPFAPTTVVVGSHLVARWLVRELALGRGIYAGVDLITFDRFVEQTWAGDQVARDAGLRALDKSQLAAALASVLADARVVSRLPVVRRYLDAAPLPGDRAGPRRVQLAEHVAQLAWNYALTRPEWMPALLAGKVPDELTGDETASWQAALIGEAMRHAGCEKPDVGPPPCAPVPSLPWARRRLRLAPPVLTRPVFVFGVSYVQRSQLEALADLASTTDVTVYLLDPCAELWDDVSGRGKAKTDGAVDPLPLTMWGRAVRDTLGALVERTGGDLEAAFVEQAPRNVREQLLDDVLHRRLPERASSLGATGIRVLACPDARREIEIVAAEIRARLDADRSLSARDIGVWLASDAERYLAQAPAAFEALGVPRHLVDAPIDDRGRIGEAVLALLELPTGGMTRRELLRVMTHPAVLANHPHVDADDWIRWTEKLGIVHGADEKSHAGTYLAAHPGHFHWDQGVRRLALGAFMIGGQHSAQRGPAKIGGLDVVPEEVRPEKHASAATYALLVRSLCADVDWLSTHEATLTEWSGIFVALVDAYLGRRTDDAMRDVERVRSVLAGIAHVDLDSRRVGFREAREHAVRKLVDSRADRGEPLAAGVMIAPLRAMRPIPFRVVFVVGLAEGAFPAGDQPSPLDLRKDPRPGDVSPRDRDRHAFLEALLGARDELILSYVAVEPKGGQALGPSSVVLELADALAPYLGAASSRLALEQLTTRYPLHRWSGTTDQALPPATARQASSSGAANQAQPGTTRQPSLSGAADQAQPGAARQPSSSGAADQALPPAVARERWAVRVRDAMRAHLRAGGHIVPDEDGMFALLAHPSLARLREELGIVDAPPAPPPSAPSRPVTLANLRVFLEAPVQAWAQAVLGLDEVPDDEVVEHSDEPFHVEKPARALLLREVLSAQLRDPGADPEQTYLATVRDMELRGQFPVGVFGSAARAMDLRLLADWRRELGLIAVGSVTRLAFGRSSSPAAELRSALELSIGGGRTVRLVGQTELLVREGQRFRSVIPMVGKAEKKSRYHLRGALDHVVLAAAGIASGGHRHTLIDREASTREVEHLPWTQDEARAYLAELVTDLLDGAHGYLLPFDHLVSALAGKPPATRLWGEGDTLLGFGPIDRLDGLGPPRAAAEIARRRLAPLVARMKGDHSLGGES